MKIIRDRECYRKLIRKRFKNLSGYTCIYIFLSWAAISLNVIISVVIVEVHLVSPLVTATRNALLLVSWGHRKRNIWKCYREVNWKKSFPGRGPWTITQARRCIKRQCAELRNISSPWSHGRSKIGSDIENSDAHIVERSSYFPFGSQGV